MLLRNSLLGAAAVVVTLIVATNWIALNDALRPYINEPWVSVSLTTMGVLAGAEWRRRFNERRARQRGQVGHLPPGPPRP